MLAKQKLTVATIKINWQRLHRILSRDRNESTYYDLCADEERQHRKWGPDFRRYHRHAVPVDICAKLYYVRNVLQCCVDNIPNASDYFGLKKSIFGGYAMWAANREAIVKEFNLDEIANFLEIDYRLLVSPEDV